MAGKTVDNPRDKIITFRLSGQELQDLDAEASAKAVERSQVIREALLDFLGTD